MKYKVSTEIIANEIEKAQINGTQPLYQEIEAFNTNNLRKIAEEEYGVATKISLSISKACLVISQFLTI